MKVLNVHQRVLNTSPAAVGALIDSLASDDDRLWPKDRWPAMKFDGPLAPGALGGHTPIRYMVEAYTPGQSARFRFTAPRGFNGTHHFDVETLPTGGVRLRHTLEMKAEGRAMLSWPLIFRPLHDALVEDALDRAERSLGLPSRRSQWSLRVRALRWLLRPGKKKREVRAQSAPPPRL